MNPGLDADRVLLAHMRDGLDRIVEYTNAERARFDASRLVQDAVIRNLQTLAESSQRLSTEIKGTEPQIPWRELSGFRNVIVHGSTWALTSGRYGWSSNRTCPRCPRRGTEWSSTSAHWADLNGGLAAERMAAPGRDRVNRSFAPLAPTAAARPSVTALQPKRRLARAR